jgi:putative membrane protein
MLWIKALHIVFVTSWFAGLFYLPRIFVNLAQVPTAPDGLGLGEAAAVHGAERDRLLGMARRLYRFTHPLMGLALALGLWLWLGVGIGSGPGNGWMHAKIVIVLALVGYQLYCGQILKAFERGHNRRSHVWFRWFNEVPVFGLLAVCILVVVKPF